MSDVASHDINKAKEEIIRLVSGSMIKEPSFQTHEAAETEGDESGGEGEWATATNESTILSKESPVEGMLRLGVIISRKDGEFLLKLAVYIRQDLGLRGSANFIAAIAAYQPKCQPYLVAYLPKIVCLPTDWMQIATFARELPMRVTAGLPTSLRKALSTTFSQFNEFSLAKYNTESAQKKKKKRVVPQDSAAPTSETVPFTLKQLIRMLHINSPRYEVMCLLGKTYPATSSEFDALGLSNDNRAFDPAKANRRMRLAIPRTWETDLASMGNHSHVWDALVADKKLPFMAMLRNIRNIILQGCSRVTHNTILSRLRSEDQIAQSKQFPYRFFSAFDVLNIDPEKAYDQVQVKREGAPTKPKPKPATAPTPEQLASLLDEYRSALEDSVRLATKLNIPPIHGRSVVVLVGSHDLLNQVRAQGAKGIGSVRSKLDIALLLALMLQYACESCDFVFAWNSTHIVLDPVDRSVGILSQLNERKTLLTRLLEEHSDDDGSLTFPYPYLDNIINRHDRIESVLVVGDNHSAYEGRNPFPALGSLAGYLDRMRRNCNPDLLFVSLAIDGSFSEPEVEVKLRHPDNVLLTGFSDSILRFIAERSGGGPRKHIERIDQVYRIDKSAVILGGDGKRKSVAKVDSNSSSSDSSSDDDSSSDSGDSGDNDGTASLAVESISRSPVTTGVRHARWFISSTFLDMQSERQALAIEVFPALRRIINEKGWKIQITEIDFRWGIDANQEQTATPVSICLNEVSRCAPFVVGVVGDRYGSLNTIPGSKIIVDSDVDANDFSWIRGMPNDAVGFSVTELELRHAAHCCASSRFSALPSKGTPKIAVLTRKMSNAVPPHLKSVFSSESTDSAAKLSKMREHLQSHSHVLTSKYDATITAAARNNANVLQAQSITSLESVVDTSAFVNAAVDLLKAQLLSYWPDLECRDSSESDDEDQGTNEADTATSSSEDGTSSSTSEAASAAIAVNLVVPSRDDSEQQWFQSNLVKTYVPPKGTMDKIERFVEGESFLVAGEEEDEGRRDALAMGSQQQNSSVLLVHSEEGRGKSAFLAFTSKKLSIRKKEVVHVVHFSLQASTAGPTQAKVRSCVRYLADKIVQMFQLQSEVVLPSVNDDDGWDTFIKQFPDLLSMATKSLMSSQETLVIVLDGFDVCATDVMLPNVPYLIPPQFGSTSSCLRWIVATHASSLYSATLRTRPTPCVSMILPDLTLQERTLLVRNHLSMVGKTLQDSVTRGSLLKTLCRKPEASTSTYLMLALTYLKTFGKFDTLKQDISRLPGTVSQLQQELIRKCEQLFDGEVTRYTLSCLALSDAVNGCRETDLLRGSSSPGKCAKLVAFLLAQEVLERRGDGDLIAVATGVFLRAAWKRYLSRTADVHKGHERMMLALLSGKAPLTVASSNTGGGGGVDNSATSTVSALCLSLATAQWVRRAPSHAIMGVLHHSLSSKHWEVFYSIASNLEALVELIARGSLPQLLVCMDSMKELHKPTYRKLDHVSQFLVLHRHILLRHPHLVAQCALNMPRDSVLYKSAFGAGLHLSQHTSWVEWRNRMFHGEKECVETLQWTRQGVLCVAFSANGKRIAVGGRDWVCRVGNALDGTITHQLKHTSDVTCVVIANTDLHLVTGSANGSIRLWSLLDGALLQEGTSHTRRINDVVVINDRSLALTVSDDTTVMLWKLAIGNTTPSSNKLRPIKTFRHHVSPVQCCALHQKGAVHASGSWSGQVFILPVDSKEDKLNTVQLPKRSSAVRSLAFTPSMAITVAVGYMDGKIVLFDAAGEVVTATFDEHCGFPITSIRLSFDAKYMISSDERGCFKLWRHSVTGEVLGAFNGHAQPISATTFHPSDSNMCLSGSLDGSVRRWKVTQQGIDIPIGGIHDAAVAALAVSLKGDVVISASRNGTAKVFQLVADGSTTNSTHSWNLWLHIKPPIHDDSGRVPLCYATIQNNEFVLGDIFGNITVWGMQSGLGGNDAPHRFSIRTHLSHPIVAVLYNTDSKRWRAVTTAGEVLAWTIRNADFAVSSDSIDIFGNQVAIITNQPESAVVMAAVAPSEEVDSHEDDFFVISEKSMYLARHQAAHVETQEETIYSEFIAGSTLPSEGCDVSKLMCHAMDFNQEYVVLGLSSGLLCVKPLGAAAVSINDVPVVVHLHDDRSPSTPLRIACVKISKEASPRSLIVCGGEDMTIRVYGLSFGGSHASPLAMFHGTACISKVTFAGPTESSVVAGDSLGNVYMLDLHLKKSAMVTQPAELGATTSVEDTASASTESVLSSGETRSLSVLEDDESHFSELGCPMPVGLSALQKKEWMKRQRSLFLEAAKIQRSCVAARTALRRHADRNMRMINVFMTI